MANVSYITALPRMCSFNLDGCYAIVPVKGYSIVQKWKLPVESVYSYAQRHEKYIYKEREGEKIPTYIFLFKIEKFQSYP